MIALRRIHMINWMYYGMQTVELAGSNLLTGNTGSGKSSMIDALQIVMLGQVNSNFFNKSAAGQQTDRTVRTYLRGCYSEDEYKRPAGAFSSYIVLDFTDDFVNEDFCFGIVFDLEADDTMYYTFFQLDCHFQLAWAARNMRVALARKAFFDAMKLSGIPCKAFTTNQEYQDNLLARLRIHDRKFFQVFKTAVAYVPLDKIEDFIIHNICHVENTVNVEKMRTSIIEYQQMLRDMQDFETRKAELEEIRGVFVEHKGKLELLEEQRYCVQRAGIGRLEETRCELEKSMSLREQERAEVLAESEKLKQGAFEARRAKDEVLEEYHNDPQRRRKQELRDLCTQRQKELDLAKGLGERQGNLLNQRCLAWKSCLGELEPFCADLKLDRATAADLHHRISQAAQYIPATLARLQVDRFADTAGLLSDFQQKAQEASYQLGAQIREADATLQEKKLQLRKLEQGKKPYRDDLLQLQAYLSGELGAKVEILADLIDVTDARWVDVVEGYLRRQKLYLIVEPRHYKRAARLFREYSSQHRCCGYNLVNTAGIMEDKKIWVQNSSLAEVISTANPYARKYVDFILGRVARTERIEEATGRSTAVTADGMLYTAYSLSRMNRDWWRQRFIGSDSIRHQIEQTKREIDELKTHIDHLNETNEPLKRLCGQEVFSREFLENLGRAVAQLQRVPELEKSIEEFRSQLDRVDDSYAASLRTKAEEFERKAGSFENLHAEKQKRIGALDTEIATINEQISESLDQKREEEESLELRYRQDPQRVRFEEVYERRLAQKRSAGQLYDDLERSHAVLQTQSALHTLGDSFRRKVEAFNLSHTDAAISTDIGGDEWRKAYEAVQDVDVAQYALRVEEARRRSEEIFQNEFLGQIKKHIDSVFREIKQLNQAIQYQFGRVRYRFKCEPTHNKEMRAYYDMIMSSALDGVSLYNMGQVTEDMRKYEAQIKTLFSLISSESSPGVSRHDIEAQIEKFKSFHTYLHFDLVEVDDQGREHPLSRSMGSKSGGERQTPFYIAILASLMKTYRMKADSRCLRLVVFDEAFDKIDTLRIEECIRMLNDNGFQSIIAAPNEKTPYIAPLLERTLVVARPDALTSVVHPYQEWRD